MTLGECQDNFGSTLKWKKCGYREGFRMLEASEFKKLHSILVLNLFNHVLAEIGWCE